MSIESLLKTTVSKDEPLDGSKVAMIAGEESKVSDFLTLQSLTNFAVMTASIYAAWSRLIALDEMFKHKMVPFVFSISWGVVALLISTDAFKKDSRWNKGKIAAAVFIAVINSLILFSAVIGASSSTMNGS